MPQSHEMVHWAYQGRKVDPEPWETLLRRYQAGQIPGNTLVWWPGQVDWQALDQVLAATNSAAATPPAPPPPPMAAEAHPAAPVAPPAPPAPFEPAAPPASAVPAAPVREPVATPEAGIGSQPAASPTLGSESSVAATAAPSEVAVPPTSKSATDILMSGMSDDELDLTFMNLVDGSWEIYKESQTASSVDEAFLAGAITALVDCGFVLIDITTEGMRIGSGQASTLASGHELRFEEPSTKARVLLHLHHLTPDAGSAKILGHRAAAVIGYGAKLPNITQVANAMRQEAQAAMVDTQEPGSVSFDADLSSGYVYAQVDLLLQMDQYFVAGFEIDHDLLRRHLASVVYTMKSFVNARFSG